MKGTCNLRFSKHIFSLKFDANDHIFINPHPMGVRIWDPFLLLRSDLGDSMDHLCTNPQTLSPKIGDSSESKIGLTPF